MQSPRAGRHRAAPSNFAIRPTKRPPNGFLTGTIQTPPKMGGANRSTPGAIRPRGRCESPQGAVRIATLGRFDSKPPHAPRAQKTAFFCRTPHFEPPPHSLKWKWHATCCLGLRTGLARPAPRHRGGPGVRVASPSAGKGFVGFANGRRLPRPRFVIASRNDSHDLAPVRLVVPSRSDHVLAARQLRGGGRDYRVRRVEVRSTFGGDLPVSFAQSLFISVESIRFFMRSCVNPKHQR